MRPDISLRLWILNSLLGELKQDKKISRSNRKYLRATLKYAQVVLLKPQVSTHDWYRIDHIMDIILDVFDDYVVNSYPAGEGTKQIMVEFIELR